MLWACAYQVAYLGFDPLDANFVTISLAAILVLLQLRVAHITAEHPQSWI